MIPVFIKCRRCHSSCVCDMPDEQVWDVQDNVFSCTCGGSLEISEIDESLEVVENPNPRGFNVVDLMRVVRN